MRLQHLLSLILVDQPTLLHILNRQPYEVLKQRIVVNDTFWNLEQLERKLSAVDSITVVNGIKAMAMLLK